MDSISLLYWKKCDFAYTIDYGQICSKREIDASKYVCEKLSVNHKIISIDCTPIGSGSLNKTNRLNVNNNLEEWWPFRNQLLITFAAAQALKDGVTKILIATVKSDLKFKDGSPTFINTIKKLLKFQEGNIILSAPSINMTSLELVLKSRIGLDLLSSSYSCTRNNNIACGNCQSCKKAIEILELLKYGNRKV